MTYQHRHVTGYRIWKTDSALPKYTESPIFAGMTDQEMKDVGIISVDKYMEFIGEWREISRVFDND